MFGLKVRTIQRIKNGHKASFESLKCLAAALDVDGETLNQERFMIDKNTGHWQKLPLFLKIWFALNFLQIRPARSTADRVEKISHIFGFLFCCIGLVSEAALAGGVIMLATAYLFYLLKWQGDKYGIWYEPDRTSST
jgi:hypothetical protein